MNEDINLACDAADAVLVDRCYTLLFASMCNWNCEITTPYVAARSEIDTSVIFVKMIRLQLGSISGFRSSSVDGKRAQD